MWRSVGTVNPNQPKHNRSRDQSNHEPFAQASRLRMNESMLSGQAQPHFMNEYFGRKRASQGTLQRVLSHKNIQTRPFVSPPSSLREVESARIYLKSQNNEALAAQMSSLLKQRQSIEKCSLESKQSVKKIDKSQLQAIKGELKAVRADQNGMKKSITNELNSFRKELREVEEEIKQRLERLEGQKEKQKRENVNPEFLNKIRQQSIRFNERMRQIDGRKEQIRQKYRLKLQNV